MEELVRDRDMRSTPEDMLAAIRRLRGIGLIHHTTDDLYSRHAALHFDRLLSLTWRRAARAGHGVQESNKTYVRQVEGHQTAPYTIMRSGPT